MSYGEDSLSCRTCGQRPDAHDIEGRCLFCPGGSYQNIKYMCTWDSLQSIRMMAHATAGCSHQDISIQIDRVFGRKWSAYLSSEDREYLYGRWLR